MAVHAKYERAARDIEAARKARGLIERRCPNCNWVMGEYKPPIGLYYSKCRNCGLYSEISTENQTPD